MCRALFIEYYDLDPLAATRAALLNGVRRTQVELWITTRRS